MKQIDDLIKAYDDTLFEDETSVYIKARLKMIRSFAENIKGSEEKIYVEDIISKFAEIVKCQKEQIDAGTIMDAAEAGYGPEPGLHRFVSRECVNPNVPVSDAEYERFEKGRKKELNPYLPQKEGFQNDEEIKKAFTNYLTYHVERRTKSGKEKPFSVHTVYDYCSRLKVLWEIAYREWLESGRDSQKIQINEEKIVPGCAFLNAYQNLEAMERYLEDKKREARMISDGRIPALSEEEMQKNPLNNLRNLGNTSAALMKLWAFKINLETQNG